MYVGSSSSVDVSTLLGYARFLTDTLENVSAFSDANILALINLEQKEIQTYILSQIMYDFKENALDGTGNGLMNLTAGTNYLAFPTDMLSLDRLEINYTGGTNTWVPVNIVKMNSIDQALSNTSGNVPIRGSNMNPVAWLRNNRIYLDPIPDASVTGGLKAWCTTILTDLIVGVAATSLPAFAGSFHSLLAYGPALKWLRAKEQYSKADRLSQERASLLAQMVEFYSKRDSDSRPRFMPKSRQMR